MQKGRMRWQEYVRVSYNNAFQAKLNSLPVSRNVVDDATAVKNCTCLAPRASPSSLPPCSNTALSAHSLAAKGIH